MTSGARLRRLKAPSELAILPRDTLSQPMASTPSLGYTGLIARAASQTLFLALRQRSLNLMIVKA